MNFTKLIIRNITFYIRYYKLIAAAVLITVAIIVGSLVVGESVRSTLINRVNERLGNTETILFSMNSFVESSITSDPLLGGNAQAVLLSDGFISDGGRLIPVMVWGLDGKDVPAGGAKVNAALASELSLAEGGDIVLRLPATGLVPSGSLFVTDNYTTSARLTHEGVIAAQDGGNLNLKNEQVIPYNIFVNRIELASILEVDGKINLIMYNGYLSGEELATIWTPALSGIRKGYNGEFTEISSDRVFIQETAVKTLCENNRGANRLFSYLVNSIDADNNSIPYSFATAVDRYKGQLLSEDDVILSDYAANRLNVKVGDSIQLTYYISKNLKTLYVDTLHARVKEIVPLSELVADKTLSADFPGLSDVEKCTDWDSDLPINMNLITKEDEDYWARYRSTPKIIVSYKAVSERWSNSYGSATAIRIDSPSPDMKGLDPTMFGLQLLYPREIGLNAARNGVDFSTLFLSLGFFIILSAILLMLVPLSEMIYQRRGEITLLTALGYSKKRIKQLLWKESAPVVGVSSLVGIVAGLLYTWLILLLLGSLWKGATQTGGFNVYPDIRMILIGLVSGMAIALLLLRITINRSLNKHAGNLKIRRNSRWWKLGFALVFSFATLCLIVVNLAFINSATLFVVVGITLIITAALWLDDTLSRRGTSSTMPLSRSKLIWASLYANRKRVLLSFFTLTSGVFIVFSVGLNRKGFADSSQLLTGTGGYSLWCESKIPVYHNIATQQGRDKLALTELPEDTRVLQIARYNADDASCLNLNKVSRPTVLGVDMEQLKNSDFKIQNSIYPAASVFDALRMANDSVYPVLVDATVLTWGLMMNLGDTIRYDNGNGRNVYLLLAGTLQNSIFQGNVLIDKELFSEIWGEITGSEIILFNVKEAEIERTKMLVAQALNQYGVKVTTTAQRLKEFNRVTDTYLTIFLTLGGLGLLLGIMSFIIVVRKDLASRKEQIALYRSLGFSDKRISEMLTSESLLVPLFAVVAGVLGSLAGIGGGFMNVSVGVWLLAFVLTLFLIACILVFITKSIKKHLSNH